MAVLTEGRLTYCDFVARVLSRRVHSPSARGDAAQGIIYLYTSSTTPIPTPLTVQVGLLSKDNTEQIPFAYRLYKSTTKRDEALASGFKETFSRAVPIDFVGVW
jgi:hypothetical protein